MPSRLKVGAVFPRQGISSLPSADLFSADDGPFEINGSVIVNPLPVEKNDRAQKKYGESKAPADPGNRQPAPFICTELVAVGF